MNLSDQDPPVQPLSLNVTAGMKRPMPEQSGENPSEQLMMDQQIFTNPAVSFAPAIAPQTYQELANKSNSDNSLHLPPKLTRSGKEREPKDINDSEEDIDPSKAKKKAANRKSAKASRERRKQYIEKLKAQVEDLKHKLDEANHKIEKYEYTSRLQCTILQDSAAQIRPKIQNLMDKVILAHKACDQNTQKLAFQNLFVKFGTQAEERRRAIEIMFRRIIDLILPLPYKYLMFASENNSGFYNILNQCKGLDAKNNEKEVKEEMETIVDYVKTTDAEFKQVFSTKEFVDKQSQLIREKVKNLLQAKKELFEKINEFDFYCQRNILMKISISSSTAYLAFLDRVKNRPELSDQSIYKLTKEDFDGINTEHVRIRRVSGSLESPEPQTNARPINF